MPIDREFVLRTLRELIRIDSRNPGLEAGAPGEREAAEHVRTLLQRMPWDVELHDLGDGRANVVATRRGTGGGRSLMVNVHLDTVGVEGMEDPFGAELRDGRIWGRGAQDVKGGVAAALGLARGLSEDGIALRGDLVLAFVADEEHESLGTTDLLRRVRTDAAIVLEPSELDVCVAHRGFGVFRLRTRGRSAHGGRADLGIDANAHMAAVVATLGELEHRWREEHRHPLLGSSSLHVPLIAGGRSLFVYSDSCTAHLECRTVPGQTREGVEAELRELLDALAARVPGLDAGSELVQWRQPYDIDPGREIVRTVRAATERVRGAPPRLVGHPWWEDSALLGEAGIEAVVLGPRGGGLHTEEEWVDPDSVVDLAGILHESALAFCGRAEGTT